MKCLKTFVICVLLFLLERVFFAHVTVFSLVPWLVLGFWFDMAAMSEETGYIPLYAGICGLVLDLTGGGYPGVNTAVFAVAGFLVNIVASCILRSGFIMSMAVMMVTFIISHIFCIILNGISLNGMFFSLILPQAVINTVFAAIMYPAVKRLYFWRRVLI